MVYFLCLCLSLLLNLATPTFPSRPPAPLLSGAGQYFITVSIELDPYDYLKHNNVSHKINAYELQMEKEQQSTQNSINDFRGIFQDVLFKIVPSNETHQSATVFSLTPAVGYRFRIRALNSFGSSPWSSPSEMFKTRETVPSAPKNLTILNTDINSAELSWDAADTQDSNGNKHFRNYPSSYHVQYRPSIFSTTNQQHNKQNQTIWINHHSEISAILKLPVLEVQQITTLVDDNDSISSGLFWIKLKVSNREIKKKYAAKLESYISAGISHNASSDEFKLAMVNIKGIQIKRVSRYEPGSYGSSIHSKRGAYAWRVEFKMPNEKFQNDRAFIPLMEIYKDTINGKYSGGNIRAEIRRLERGQSPIVKTSSNTLKIEGLQNYSYYDFRVRGKNYYGFSPWSGVLLEVQTLPLLPKYPSKVPTSQQLNSKFVKQIEGRGRLAGNEFDPDYIPRTAIGGLNEENGSNGLAVIISSGAGQTTPSRTYFYCTGASQMYVVPTGSGFEIDSSVTDRFITIKLWGAGGAGGTGEVITPRQSFNLSSMKESLSNGGGGGFVESRISVSADEILTVQVGCGGKFYNSRNKSVEDHGGYPGGGKGGISVMGQGTGSGGGHSSILQSGTVIIAAGGGGGGGSTDYCCAHGGVGGGTSGGNGSSPITPNTAKTVSKNYFEPIGCKSSSCYKRQYKENIAANVDYGFAPNASYDRPATEGNGGNFLNPGFGGYSGNYVVMENLISSIALSGSYGFGGNGADGKEGGGGGGSGFFGGGGGGSGVDGTGGGGGSGYVDFTFIYVPERRGHGKIGPDQPQVPEVTAISHNTFSLSWRNPSIQNVGYTAGFDTKRFDIELSQGREGSGMEGGKCSEDFKLVNTIQIDHLEITMNATITGLQPDTIYCARLISISDQGRSERGDAIEIITTLLPEHKWNQISPRKNLLTLQNVKLASEYNLCQRNPTPAIPPPRRGHSLSSIHGNLYLFGGITEVCICVEDSCSFNTVFSNELWKYEITTKIWKRLQSHSSSLSIPQGREEHSATVLSNGKLLIVGGKTSKSKNYEASEDVLFLGDVWEMDIGQVTHHTISGSYSNDLPTSLGNSDAFYHTKKVSIYPEPASRQGELCLKSLVVQISLEHACAQQIEYISIFGPKSRSSMKDFPANRQEEAKLFVRSQISISENECDAVISNITFSDTATNNILDNSYVLPSSGIFLPAEDLASHFSQQVNGEWTLVIYDNVNDNIVGMLVDWNIHFEVDYCFEGLQWTKLSNGSNACETSTLIEGKGTPNDCMNVTDKSRKKIEKFTPRYLHTSVAVKNTIYVMGGYFHGIVKESWRFDYFSKLWTQLHHSRSEKPHWYGQYATLTRWGYMVMYGGKRNHFESSYLERNIWLFKISDGTRTFVKANFSESPKSRYLSAISYIELVEENLTIQNNIFRDIEPLLVMFGGDMDLPNNNFLGDMWSLLLQESRIEKDTICESLLNSFSDDYNKWEWSCGAYSDINSSKPCQWEDVVTMAWCQGEYFQSFYSPL